MQDAATRYARRVLLIHVLVFIGLLIFVVVAAREVYERTREEAIAQARVRQALLVNQTARGIESFYQSVFNDMDLLRRADEGEISSAGPAIGMGTVRTTLTGSLLWQQLKDRASHVFIFDKATRAIRVVGSEPSPVNAATISEKSQDWLASIDAPAVSKYQQYGDMAANLICVPSGDKSKVIVSVVPVADIDRRFLQEVNKQATMGVTLLDESLATMATSNKALVGMNILQLPIPEIQTAAKAILASGKPGGLMLDRAIEYKGVTLEPAIINAEPIVLPGKTWWIYIATALREVDSVVNNVFRRAIIWAGVAIVGMTALLVSTAITLIRGRVRMERLRHDMLRKELDQARDIQLAWLPESTAAAKPRSVDIAAINTPASHISGDFYNWFELEDGRTVITIGDVTGHGMSAAFLMATTQLLVRTTMPRVGDPGKCLEEVNRQLCVQVFHGQFVTMSLLVLDLANGYVDIATAGHPPPLVSEGGAYTELPITPELVLGIEKDITYPSERFPLPAEASMLLYTDGVPDAQAPSDERLGTAGLQKALFGQYPSAQALLEATVRVVDGFRGPRALNDDLTLVAIQLTKTSVAHVESVGV